MTAGRSPFDRATTAFEVASGYDLTGRRAIVTGANSGLGVPTALALAGCGAEVVLAVRDPASAQPVVDRIVAAGGMARASRLDLGDLASVAAFAEREGGGPLHLLVNNAGIMATPQGQTAQGFESQLGINHIGHFHLATLLLPALRRGAKVAGGARVVSVSSSGHHWSPFRFDDPNFRNDAYDPLIAYGSAKTANALFAVELDRRFRAAGIRAFSLMPGAIRTALDRYMSKETMARLGIGKPEDDATSPIFWKTPEQGAATSVWAALGQELDGKGGLYLEDCQIAPPAVEGSYRGVKAWASDPDAAARLWDWTERAIADARQTPLEPPRRALRRKPQELPRMSRIPIMKVDDLTAEEQHDYHHKPGGNMNLGLLLAHARTMRKGLGEMVGAMMTGIEVPPLERQICVLAVLHLDRGAYEWAQHLQVSRQMGIPDAKVAAIADDRFGDPVFDSREKALLAFTRQVVKTVRVDDFVFDAVKAFYSPRQIVELIHVIGLYMLFARVSEVAELEIDAVAGADFWKEANASSGSGHAD